MREQRVNTPLAGHLWNNTPKNGGNQEEPQTEGGRSPLRFGMKMSANSSPFFRS